MRTKHIISFCLAMLLIACGKDVPQEEYAAVFDAESVTINKNSSASSDNRVQITASDDVEWNVALDGTADWLTIASASGNGNGAVVFALAANDTFELRTAKLTITAASNRTNQKFTKAVTVNQIGLSRSVLISPSESVTVSADTSDELAIAVTSNAVWTASASADWITIVEPATPTDGNGVIRMTFSENTSDTPRTACLMVKCRDEESVSASLTIVQRGATVRYRIAIDGMTGYLPAGEAALRLTTPSGIAKELACEIDTYADRTEIVYEEVLAAGHYTMVALISDGEYIMLNGGVDIDNAGAATLSEAWNADEECFGTPKDKLATYGAPADYTDVPLSTIYRVSLIQRNKKTETAVFTSICPSYRLGYQNMTSTDRYPLDLFAGRSISWAEFSFSGEVVVEVEILNTSKVAPSSSVRIIPSRYNITPEVNGNTIRFRMTNPGQCSVEIDENGYKNGLMIFADPMEENAPSATDDSYTVLNGATAASVASVATSGIWFRRGAVHDIGVYKIPSTVKNIYIEGGAWVYGTLIMDGNSDVRIFGRGTLSSYRLDYRQSHCVEAINNSNNIVLEGITVAHPKYFSVRLIGGNNRVEWVKIIGSWTYNCDGISAFAGSTVSHCFTWANDDNIKVYRDNTTVTDMVCWQLNNGGSIQMSWGGAMANNINIRRVDILHAEWNNQEHNRGVLSCVGDKYQAGKSGYLTNWHIEDVVTETAVPLVFRVSPYDYSPCPIHGLELKNWNIKMDKSKKYNNYIVGLDPADKFDGFVFDNVVLNGTKLTEQNWIAEGNFIIENLVTPTFK